MHKRNMKIRRFYPRQVFNRLRKRKSGTHTTGEMHALWFFLHGGSSLPLFRSRGPRLELVDGVAIHNVLTGTFKLRRNGEDVGRGYFVEKGQSSYEFVKNVRAMMNSSSEN